MTVLFFPPSAFFPSPPPPARKSAVLLERSWFTPCVGVLVLLLALHLEAAPQITNLSVRGLQLGGTTTLVIDGRDLSPAPQLHLPIASADVVVRDGASDQRIEAQIKLPKGASPGIYPLRVCSGKGVSSPVLVGVDALPQQPLTAHIETLPAALHGRISGNQIKSSTFPGKKGQRIVLDVEAKRLGSPLEPVVRLYDPHGAQIAWSPPKSAVGGDARCEAVLKADGQYSIELHDRLYRAKGSSFFRLKVGDLQYADIAFPLAVTAGEPTSLSLIFSSLPDDLSLKIKASKRGAAPVDMSAVEKFTGPQPAVIVSDLPELLEQPTDEGEPQVLPAAPVAVNGRISAKEEEDIYHLPVQAGAKLRIEVLADRAGSALDGVLTVKRAAGQQLARSDDRPGTSDPGVEVTVPKGETMLAISLRDLRGDGGAEFVYRLLVEPVAAGRLSVSTSNDAITVPAGGSQVIRVQARRNGVRGPIRLELTGLPEGVSVAGAEIAGGDIVGLVSLTAADQGATCGIAGITAVAKDGDRTIEAPVLLGETDANSRQPWLRERIAIAAAPAAPVRLAWGGDINRETMWLGGSTPLSVTVERREGAQGKLRLRLLTTQSAPQKTVKQGRQNAKVDDEARTLRLEKAVELPGDAAQAEVRLAVPNDLAERPYRVALVGELLAGDGKTVLATAAAPVRRLVARRAIQLAVEGETKIKAIAGDGGETGVLKGTVQRTQGVMGPVTLTLTGLPGGYKAPTLELPKGQTKFAFAVRFPADAKPAELKDVRLLAATRTNPAEGSSTVKSNEVPVTLSVVSD
jgi:hypothetical protein